MNMTEKLSPDELALKLLGFREDCESAGRAIAHAGDGLSRLEEFPNPALIQSLEHLRDGLRDGLRSLHGLAAALAAGLGDLRASVPDPEAGLGPILGFVQAVIAATERQTARMAHVRGLLSQVARLTVREGEDLPALASIRARAVELIERIPGTADADAAQELVRLSNQSHPFWHLVRLVHASEISPEEREESLIEVVDLGKDIARAARSNRLIIEPGNPVIPDPEICADNPPPEAPVHDPAGGPAFSTPVHPAGGEGKSPLGPDVRSNEVGGTALAEPLDHTSSRSDRDHRRVGRPLSASSRERAAPRRPAFRPKPTAIQPLVPQHPLLGDARLSRIDKAIGTDRGPDILKLRILPDEGTAPTKEAHHVPNESSEPAVPAHRAPLEASAHLVGDFPDHLRDFDTFRGTHWINSAGRCESSPWTRPDFAAALTHRTAEELCRGRSARLLLFARAAEASGLAPMYQPRDVEALAALLAAPLRAEAGKDLARGMRLTQAIRDDSLDDAPDWRLAVTLEAVRPSGELVPTGDVPEELVDYTGFHHEPLRRALKELLTLIGRGNLHPLNAARSVLLVKTPLTPEQRKAQLKSRREDFRQLVARHYSAGGRLKLSHCRDAWREFMRQGKGFFETLFPASDRDILPDPARVASQADLLWSHYETIANRGGVKYGERRRMDRMVELILDQAEEIGELARLIRIDSGTKVTSIEPTLLESLTGLRESQPPPDPTEMACRRLLLMLLDEAPDPGDWKVLELTVGDLARHPGLVSLIPVEAAAEVIAAATDLESVCPCDDVDDPLTAAALLLESAIAQDDGFPDRSAGLRLYDVLQGQPERGVRLVRLLSDPQRAAARRALERLRDEAQERVNGLKTVRDALDALVSPWARAVAQVYQAGLRLVDDPATEEFSLALAWLDQALESARGRLEAEVALLVARVRQSHQGDVRDQALRAIAEARYGDALRTLGEAEVDLRDDGRRLRETLHRKVASEQFGDPKRSIARSTDPVTAELRASWRDGINGQDDRKFRNDFLRFLCSKKSRRRTSTPLEKEARFDNQDCRLSTRAIRERIAEFGLNPCYLPQLTDFGELIILVPPTQVRSSDFVRKTAAEVARRGKAGFFAVLAPAVSTAARDALLKEFRDRKLVAAVIDDLDFCRLLNPGGEPPDPLVGFFEIFLEQQRWEPLSPYSNRLVEKEMFVGRLDEAGDLKRTNKYSRLFSGRKLGKTSLLNHVQQTSGDDAEKLPSGNTLRVLLITSVGPDAREVVDQIRIQMSERLGYQPERPLARIDPGDELVTLMDGFVADRPRESLLVIIDEADSLFEAELEHYESKRERCLSFRMSREVERKHLDSEGLPRVRFLFSGYRVTNKSEGVWANWGDVLRLSPLWPQDADNLAAGPLARMGIDLGDQTRVVSWRCGYQPAVLLRFGRELLSHLDKTHPQARRDHVRVTPEDVAQVFHREAVRDEIRTVVRYNFIPGNRLGELVFEALLLEFLCVPPAAGLPEAPKRVLDRLRAIDEDTSWLQVHEASAESEIERQISDFVERQLLTERYEGDDKVLVHRLRFPHHLAVLCPNEPDGDRKLREGIAAFRRGEASTAAGVRSLLGPKGMEDLRYVTTRPEHPDEPARAAIVGSVWPEAIAHRSFGVPILLGFDSDSTIRGDGRIGQPALASRRLAVVCSGQEEVQRILQARDPQACRPLFTGGADLLRWAIRQSSLGRDGVDLVHYGLGRLSRGSLLWWFSRVRRLGLPPTDPIGRIYEATGGMPLLVRHFDMALLDKGIGAENTSEEEVSDEDFRNALERCRSDLPLLARRLISDDPVLRLSGREIQILSMIAKVCRSEGQSCTAETLRFGLSEAWDDFYRADGMEEAPAVDNSADQEALALLQGLGYLPFDPNRSSAYPLGRLDAPGITDPLWTLVELLKPEAAP